MRINGRSKEGIRRVLAEDLADERTEAETEQHSQQRRIQRLKDERQKLLDGYYAGAVPLDLLKSEQDRIGRGLAAAEDRLRKLTTKFDRIEEVITRAMAWADQLHLAYQAADDPVRRLLNQAVFTKVFVNGDGVVGVEYTEGFAQLLAESDEAEGETACEQPVPWVQSAEREHHDKRPSRRAGAFHRRSTVQGWNVKRLVVMTLSYSNRGDLRRRLAPFT